VAKRTNPEPGGSPSGSKGTPGGTCISNCGKPNYPSAARKQEREGRVVLIFDIDPNGKAINIDILTSSNHDDLDREAIKAVEKWKFASSENGLQRQTTAIKFRLEDYGFF
jgi:protein TonB